MSTYKKDEEQLVFSYPSYQESDVVKQANALLQQHTASKPGAFQSQWTTKKNNALNAYTNRQPFQYDVNGDALYQQYKDRYIQNGQRAMQDTMGQAAALTGGYGSSYAQNVGQQAYNQYMTGLNDVIPELYQLALDKYDRETERLQNQYALYADLEAQDYSRHQDVQAAYYSELDRLTENARYAAEQDWSQYASGYNTAYDQYQKYVEAVAEQQEAANAPLNKYQFAGVDEDGNYRYYLDGEEYKFAQGINPHTGSVNPDVKYGTFGVSGYQPDNITDENGNSQKLTATGKTAIVNGHEQNVWKLPDGSQWVWDDTINKYKRYTNTASSGTVSSSNVKYMQQFLRVDPTGTWDAKTQAAARAKWGVTSADGAYKMYQKAYQGGVPTGDSFEKELEEGLNERIRNGRTKSEINAILSAALREGKISRETYERLKALYVPKGMPY